MDVHVSLDDDLARFVEDEVSSGRHGSSSDVLREALRLMERAGTPDAEVLRALREAWREGVDSGDAGELDFEILKAEARARFAASSA